MIKFGNNGSDNKTDNVDVFSNATYKGLIEPLIVDMEKFNKKLNKEQQREFKKLREEVASCLDCYCDILISSLNAKFNEDVKKILKQEDNKMKRTVKKVIACISVLCVLAGCAAQEDTNSIIQSEPEEHSIIYNDNIEPQLENSIAEEQATESENEGVSGVTFGNSINYSRISPAFVYRDDTMYFIEKTASAIFQSDLNGLNARVIHRGRYISSLNLVGNFLYYQEVGNGEKSEIYKLDISTNGNGFPIALNMPGRTDKMSHEAVGMVVVGNRVFFTYCERIEEGFEYYIGCMDTDGNVIEEKLITSDNEIKLLYVEPVKGFYKIYYTNYEYQKINYPLIEYTYNYYADDRNADYQFEYEVNNEMLVHNDIIYFVSDLEYDKLQKGCLYKLKKEYDNTDYELIAENVETNFINADETYLYYAKKRDGLYRYNFETQEETKISNSSGQYRLFIVDKYLYYTVYGGDVRRLIVKDGEISEGIADWHD